MAAFVATLMFLLIMVGCTEGSAKDLFETAQFEEQQHNVAHAKELYRELVTNYPQSDYARKAQERLRALNP